MIINLRNIRHITHDMGVDMIEIKHLNIFLKPLSVYHQNQ